MLGFAASMPTERTGPSPQIEVLDLSHRYGARAALDGVAFSVDAGEIFGLLGPNGGGKSTLFRILTTLQRPMAGSARVAGHDVVREARAVRRVLGVVFQHPSVDAQLTVAENLAAHGALYGLSGSDLRRRVDEQLDRFGLSGRRRDLVGTLSGGLARRVEVAKTLLTGPPVILMDEPSAGLDPVARRDLMDALKALQAGGGVTILLTTHHMEEAERCDRVGILDAGRLVAVGSPERLKSEVGEAVVTIRTRDLARLAAALREQFGVQPAQVDGVLRFEASRPHEIVHRVVDGFGDAVDAVSFGRPTLEDAFFHLTGRRFEPGEGLAA